MTDTTLTRIIADIDARKDAIHGGLTEDEALDLLDAIACDVKAHMDGVKPPEETELENLRAANMELAAQISKACGGWQPIEAAPKDGARILAIAPKYGPTTAHFDHITSDRWSLHSVLNRDAIPTHWMPLPNPPKESSHD